VLARPATQYYVMPHAPGGAAALFAQWLGQACARVATDALALVSGPR
jgi:hypothetical protein